MAPEHGLCTSAVLKISAALWTSRTLEPHNFFGILFKFRIKLLRGIRVSEEFFACVDVSRRAADRITARLCPQGDPAWRSTAEAVAVESDASAESTVPAVLFCFFGIGLG